MNIDKKQSQWYTEDQCGLAKDPHRIKTVNAYISIINNALEDYIKIHPGKSYAVLDAGCGDGVILKELIQNKQLTVTGIDNNLIRIERCKKFISQASIFQRDITATGFPDQHFNIIIVHHVLEHIADVPRVLQELHRILLTNGVLIVGTPNEGCLLARLRNHILQRRILQDTDHVHFFTRKILKNTLESAYFSIKKIKTQGFFLPYTKLSEYIIKNSIGFSMLETCGKIFPSQAASLYFICEKK